MKATPDGQGGFNIEGNLPSGDSFKAVPDCRGGFDIGSVIPSASGEAGIVLLILGLIVIGVVGAILIPIAGVYLLGKVLKNSPWRRFFGIAFGAVLGLIALMVIGTLVYGTSVYELYVQIQILIYLLCWASISWITLRLSR